MTNKTDKEVQLDSLHELRITKIGYLKNFCKGVCIHSAYEIFKSVNKYKEEIEQLDRMIKERSNDK